MNKFIESLCRLGITVELSIYLLRGFTISVEIGFTHVYLDIDAIKPSYYKFLLCLKLGLFKQLYDQCNIQIGCQID